MRTPILIESKERWLTPEEMEEERLKNEKLKTDPKHLKSIVEKWKHVLHYNDNEPLSCRNCKCMLIEPQEAWNYMEWKKMADDIENEST